MKRLVCYVILILTVGLLPCWIQYGGFMLTTDFLNQQIPFIMETKRMFASGTPFWSWNTYFGDNFIGAYSFYTLTSPFVWLNCLFPVEYIYESITLTLYLKFICLAAVSFLYFRKMEISEESSIAGSLLFVFSSFVIINLGYYHFMEPMICFPIFLWSIEKFLQKEKYGRTCLCLTSFGVLFTNFYFAPCTFFSGLVYFVFRVNALCRTKKLSCCLTAFSLVATGGLLASFVVVPTLFHLMGGPRTEIELKNLLYYNLAKRVYSLFCPILREGPVPLCSFTGWSSTAAHLPVVGLMLAMLYVLRNRSSWLSGTLVCLLVLYLTPLNGVFSLFTNPGYTRWAYALSFMIVLASIKFLDEKSNVSMRSFYIYAVVCVGVWLWIYLVPVSWRIYRHIPFVDDEIPCTLIAAGLLVGSLVLLYIYCKRRTGTTLIGCVVLFATLHLGCFSFAHSDAYSTTFQGDKIKIGIFDTYVRNNPLGYHLTTPAYRTYFVTRQQPFYSNVSLLKNVPGVICYNSVQNNKARKMFLCADSTLTEVRISFQPNINLTSFNALMSVRDVVKYHDEFSAMSMPELGALEEKNERFSRFSAKYYIPFGFTYDHYMLQSSIDSLLLLQPKPDVPLMMLKALSVQEDDEDIMSRYMEKTTVDDSCTIEETVRQRNGETCTHQQFTTTGFTCQSNLKRENLVFFSVPADEGFTARIDGRQTRIYEVNCGLSGIVVPKGTHEIEFSFVPKGLYAGILISLLALMVCGGIFYFDYKKQ